MQLNRDAALQSASWGRFQIMGFNHKAAGYATVDSFVQAMYRSEGEQLASFVRLLQHQGLAAALRNKEWATFAMRYNGKSYAANHYDQKLKAAYEKYSKT